MTPENEKLIYTLGTSTRSPEELAQRRRVAILCAELLPWRCHRRFIGFELERRGWQVIHIFDEKRDWQPGKAEQTK